MQYLMLLLLLTACSNPSYKQGFIDGVKLQCYEDLIQQYGLDEYIDPRDYILCNTRAEEVEDIYDYYNTINGRIDLNFDFLNEFIPELL